MLLSSEQLTHLKECESDPEFSKYINRPLSGLFETIKIHDIRDGIKIGLILCHGHNYPNDYYRRLKFVNYWYMVDISEECFPDYICDLYSSKQLEYFPDKIFDYILDVNCRVERFPVYGLCKRLLKTTGYIITVNHFDHLGAYLDDHTLEKINKKLIGDDPDIIEYLNNFFNKEAWLKPHLEHMTDNQLTYFILNFGGYVPGKNKKIKQLKKKYSEKVLKKHGYRYIKHFGPFISKPPPFGMSYLFFKPYPDHLYNIIYLDGASSSGKTTIAKLFARKGYARLSRDDFEIKYFNQREQIPRLMIEESKKYPKVIFDIGGQGLLESLDRNKVFVVIIYAPLCDIIDNLISRKNEGDPRGLFALTIYGAMYIKTNTKKNCIDIVNRDDFIKCLDKINYEFDSQDELVKLAHNVFKDMGIFDNKNYCIKPKGYQDYDYIINVHGKTPTQIMDELFGIMSRNNY